MRICIEMYSSTSVFPSIIKSFINYILRLWMISSHDNFEKPPWIHRIIKNIIFACLIVHEFILCKPY